MRIGLAGIGLSGSGGSGSRREEQRLPLVLRIARRTGLWTSLQEAQCWRASHAHPIFCVGARPGSREGSVRRAAV